MSVLTENDFQSGKCFSSTSDSGEKSLTCPAALSPKVTGLINMEKKLNSPLFFFSFYCFTGKFLLSPQDIFMLKSCIALLCIMQTHCSPSFPQKVSKLRSYFKAVPKPIRHFNCLVLSNHCADGKT